MSCWIKQKDLWYNRVLLLLTLTTRLFEIETENVMRFFVKQLALFAREATLRIMLPSVGLPRARIDSDSAVKFAVE